MCEEEFAEAQRRLVEQFFADQPSDETSEELGLALLALILESERIRRRVPLNDPRLTDVFRETVATLASATMPDPSLAVAEGVFRRLAADPKAAAAYLERYILQRNAAQAARASKPREKLHDSVTQAIRLILEENPMASAKEVERELAFMDGFLFIDGEIRVDGERPVKVANLASRVSDAKKGLRKNSG